MQPKSNRLLVVVGATIISWILRVSLAGLACLSNPCLNGICIDDINSSFICFCSDGFTGELCGTNWDECWSSPCENGGICTDSIAAFNCSCPPGFTGERCEWNVDECASNPCLNGGTCIDQENGFVCSCPAGYAGNICNIDVSVCNISYPMPHIPGPRCFNGGICLDGPGPSFTCLCIVGWTGTRCEVQVDECASSPCKNGGLCIDLLADYSCACPFGYTGKNCEMTLQMCRGINGSRLNIFGGLETEDLEDGNEDDVCENGALCLLESDGARVCYCVPDFHGDRCQYRYDECLLAESSSWLHSNSSSSMSGDHCLNGGECIDGVDSFTCSCPSNFTGRFCECPLYGVSGEADPFCLTTSTYPSTFSGLTPESTSPVSPSTPLPISSTSSLMSQTEKSTTEISTLEYVTVTDDYQKQQTPETFTVTKLVQELSTATQETDSSTSRTEYTSTESSSPPLTGIADSTTFTADSSVSPFMTAIVPSIFPSTDDTVTEVVTDFSSSESSTDFHEFSSTRVPSIVGEDKVWFSDKMTTSSSNATVASHTDETTETSSEAPSTLVTELPDVDVTSDFMGVTISSPPVPLETDETTTPSVTYFPPVLLPESTKTEEPHQTSIAVTSTYFADTSTHMTATVTDAIPLSTKPYTSAIDEVTTSPVSEFMTTLDTSLYTSEKVSVTTQETSTEKMFPTGTDLTVKPMESTQLPVSEFFTAKETAFTVVESVDVTDEFSTVTMSHPTLGTTSGTISYSEELLTEEITQPTYSTVSIPEAITMTENVTTVETTEFVRRVTDIPSVTEFPEVEYSSKVDFVTESKTEEPLTRTVKTIETTSIVTGEPQSTTMSELSTVVPSEPSDGASTTGETSTADTTPGSESPTDIGCNVAPCLNGGTCYYNECECPFRFDGRFCERKKTVEVASFNGNSFLMHSLNISERSNQEEGDDDLGLDESKSNFKRHAMKNLSAINTTTMNGSSNVNPISEEQMNAFEEVYEYYEEYDYSHNYSYYMDEELEESVKSAGVNATGNHSLTFIKHDEISHSSSSNSNKTFVNNVTQISLNLSSSIVDYYTSPPENSLTEKSTLAENVTVPHDLPSSFSGIREQVQFNRSLNSTVNNTQFADPSPRHDMGRRRRGSRSLNSHSSISTSISVKINLQERSLRVGGWGLVMRISLGQMAKASLAINHKSGLMRFHFTCGLGRSLLFGEEDGQRWAGQGRRQPIHTLIIPVHVTLEVIPYEAVHKNNPPSGNSYLQCVASLKINGQVAVRGQQRAPMPKKSSGEIAKQNILFLGGVPNMLLPCNQAIDDSDEKEKASKYEEIPENDDDEHEGFVGCMQDLKINGIHREIFDDALDGNGVTECGDSILTGKDLEKDENPCFSLPCYGSSTCEVTEDGGWRCQCPTGWSGPSCEQSACDDNPCLYGATCLHDDVGGFVCLCPLGKGGRLCENDIEMAKPCFDSGNDWDIEEHQSYIAYPLDHNYLSSPQLVFRFKFSPASLNQIGLLAYIGDLKIPKSLQSYHSSFLSEIKDSYFETTTNSVTSDSSHLTEYPSADLKDVITESTTNMPPSTTVQEDTLTLPASMLEQNVLTENNEDSKDKIFTDFSPPLDIPLFQDDGPSYLQNFSTLEAFNSFSSYIFSPFSPYPYYLRQNGKDHMAVSYIRGHLVLTWDLGSGPRRIFTTEPLPMLHDDTDGQSADSIPAFSVDLSKYPNLMQDHALPESMNWSTNEAEPQVPYNVEYSNVKLSSEGQLPVLTKSDEKLNEKSHSSRGLREVKSKDFHASSEYSDHQVTPFPESDSANNHSSSKLGSAISVGQDSLLKSEKDLHGMNGQNAGLSLKRAQDSGNLKNPQVQPQDQKSKMAQITSPPSPSHFHEVTIWREGQQAWLKVGDQVVRGRSPGRHYQLNAHRPFLYLGGHDAKNVSSLPHDIPLHSSFSGCIFDAELRFGSHYMVLNKRSSVFTRGRGVGECGVDSCQVAKSLRGDGGSPCLNGGTCIPRGPTFICICQKPWFGPLCADSGHNPCDEGTHSCRSGSTCVVLPLGGYKCDCLPGTHGIYCEKDAPIGWGVKLTGHRSFLGVRVPFRGWKRRPIGGSFPDKPKKEAFCIDLEIKPNKPNSGGLILFVMGSQIDEYLSLSISKKGDPELRIGPGSSRMSGPMIIGYNNEFHLENFQQVAERAKVRAGKTDSRTHSPGWRKIRIFRRGQRVFLAMDGLLYGAGTLDSPSQKLPTIRPYNNSIGSSLPLLYLGGLPDLAILPPDAVGDVGLARPFAGCIRSVAVDWLRVPLGEGAGSYGRNAYAC